MKITAADKVLKLESLPREVNDIHPIIRALLPLLPHIKSFEYTHGPAEFGADFVAEKEDETLGSAYYIGIIIKKGEITLSNYHESSKQISQLELERNYHGGKTKINITEIWVISNCNITPPAQRMINKEHSTSKVHFIVGEKLTQLIDKHLPAYWENSSPALTGYLKSLKQKLDESDEKLSLLGGSTTQVYFEPELRECEKDEYKPLHKKNKTKKTIDLTEEIKTHKAILIEGDPGVGKSKMLRHMASNFLDDCGGKTPLVPIFFTFSEYDEKYNKSINNLIKKTLGESYDALWGDKSIKYILLVDSLDECKREHDHTEILKSLLDEIDKDARISCVVTTRHLDRYTVDQSIIKRVFCAEILPLSSQKIVAFLKQITKDISIPGRILEDIKKSKLFRDLPKSPIAAIILARILREEPKDLPSTLPELYNQFIEICVGRWEQQLSLKNQMEYKALDAILQNIAVYLMDTGAPHLNIDEAKQYFSDYINNRGYDIDADDFFSRTTSRCAILCLLNGKTSFAFKHRSFVEFYYAKHLITSHKSIDQNTLKSYWSHSHYFYIGLLQDPDDQLMKFISTKPSSDIESYLKYTTLSDLMLAGYSATNNIFIKGLANSAITAAIFYTNAVNNPKDSTLKNFSQIHLLWLTQYTFKHSYSYDFFKKFFDKAAEIVMGSDEDEYIKTVALFFMDVTLLTNSKTSDFKYLDDYGKSIPLAIKLGIGYESNKKKKTDFVKKIDKNMKARCKTDKKLISDIHKLHALSIDKFALTI